MPLGDDGDAIAKLNVASRSCLLVIVDRDATALECMAMGKQETHFLLCRRTTPVFAAISGPNMRSHCRSHDWYDSPNRNLQFLHFDQGCNLRI